MLRFNLLISFLLFNYLCMKGSFAAKNFEIIIQQANVTINDKSFIDSTPGDIEVDEEDDRMVVKGFINVIKNIPAEATGTLEGKQSQDGGNNWHTTLTQQDVPICDFLEKNAGIVKDLASKGTLWSKCPLNAKKVVFDNYYVDTSNFPDTMPSAKWQLFITFKLDTKEICTIMLQIKIVGK